MGSSQDATPRREDISTFAHRGSRTNLEEEKFNPAINTNEGSIKYSSGKKKED